MNFANDFGGGTNFAKDFKRNESCERFGGGAGFCEESGVVFSQNLTF